MAEVCHASQCDPIEFRTDREGESTLGQNDDLFQILYGRVLKPTDLLKYSSQSVISRFWRRRKKNEDPSLIDILGIAAMLDAAWNEAHDACPKSNSAGLQSLKSIRAEIEAFKVGSSNGSDPMGASIFDALDGIRLKLGMETSVRPRKTQRE
jgi:hypothetical protein